MLSRDQLSIGKDLHKKATFDALDAVKRVASLADDSATATFIAVGGCIATATFVARHITTDEFFRNCTPAQLADAALVASIFSLLCRHPGTDNPKADDSIRMALAGFKAATGREFDKGNLIDPLRDSLPAAD